MSNGTDVDKMTPEEKLAYLHAYVDDMITENEVSDPQLSAGLKTLKEQLDKPEKGVDTAKAIDTLAKNLPNVSKGIIAAKDAFQKGDNISGAAAIMDICAAFAPIIGAFTATGGPAGMLVGAVFSVIGQIIALFQPAKPSDVDKIKTILLSIEAEGIKEKADANLVSIRLAAQGMRDQAKITSEALKQFNFVQVVPVLAEAVTGLMNFYLGGSKAQIGMMTSTFTHNDALNFIGELKKEKMNIADFKLIDGPTVLQHWGVASWLQNTDRQDQNEWAEIFGTFCQAYADLLNGYVTLISFANGTDMQTAFAVVHPSNKKHWTYDGAEDDRKGIEKALSNLNVNASKHLDDLVRCNETMSAILAKLTPVARKRGMFVVRNSWDILPTSGPKAFKQGNWQGSLWASCSRFLITPPNEGLTTAKAQYHFWCLDTRGPSIGHERIDSESRTIVSGTNGYLGPADKVADIYVLPSPDDANANYIYCAHEEGAPAPHVGYLELFATDGKQSFAKISWAPPVKAKLFQVRAVTPPAGTLPDDPDKDALPDIVRGGKNHYNSIIYGALRSSPEIYVGPANRGCYVPSPWGTYAGVAVDPYYLWVFGTGGFACATHASVMKCIKDKEKNPSATPRWLMGPSLDYLLYDGNQYPGNREEKDGTIPPHPGLVDFCPADDGTLFISLTTRKIDRQLRTDFSGDHYYYRAIDGNSVYAAVYSTDFAAEAVRVAPYESNVSASTPWQKLPQTNDIRELQKIGIFCWSLLEGLKRACKPEAWKQKLRASA